MPIYEYDCRACGPFSEARPMAVSALPVPCPRCASQAPRMLSTVAIGRAGRGRLRRGPEPSLVKDKGRRDPPKAASRSAPPHHGGRPWMLGH